MFKQQSVHFHNIFRSFLLIFLCFLLTSAGYLSWVYHMLDLHPAVGSALFAEVIGYLFQAAGIGLFAWYCYRRPSTKTEVAFFSTIILYVIFLIPALLGESPILVLFFGLASNFLCGILAGFYLLDLFHTVSAENRAKVFGFGYGISCFILWLISIAGNFLHMKYALILYAVLAILAAFLFKSKDKDAPEPELVNTASFPDIKTLVLLAFVTILMLSLVKNLGFDFPIEDLNNGLSLELSRIFYGAGLILAGFVNDKNRKQGAVICLAALIIPFIMLALSNGSVPTMILWGLNYFFYGFFAVFRVILFSDIAEKTGLVFLASFGLLAGRIGDAAGTSVFLLLDEKPMFLVIVTATLFILTVFLFFYLYQQFYMPVPQKEKSEQQRFDAFVQRFSCSQRERDVLKLLLEEHSNQEIATRLFVSESTVKFHIHNLLKKTGCKNRLELITLYRAD